MQQHTIDVITRPTIVFLCNNHIYHEAVHVLRLVCDILAQLGTLMSQYYFT
jgi:hypothetical protein